jgi:hypothetical protein
MVCREIPLPFHLANLDAILNGCVARRASYKTLRSANSLVIHYGKIPTGFEQEVPTAGEPPPLVEGKTYLAVAGGTGYVPWARVTFMVKDNQTFVVSNIPESN